MTDKTARSESAAATAFFCALARHVHYDTTAWAYADTVGHDAGYSSGQIDSYVYMLGAAGLIEERASRSSAGVERVLLRLTVAGREYARTVCSDGY
ncbi:MAG: hypothetical protein ACXV5T_03135 [Halobacteriota archaeon]